ncbi:hypothetical protein BDZ91DRAFT_766468 [Kalaharituber pfeilii]|nr:hypothetical protein BDZ91DRAFT_766468 [Kalaharituber pfeilii]
MARQAVTTELYRSRTIDAEALKHLQKERGPTSSLQTKVYVRLQLIRFRKEIYERERVWLKWGVHIESFLPQSMINKLAEKCARISTKEHLKRFGSEFSSPHSIFAAHLDDLLSTITIAYRTPTEELPPVSLPASTVSIAVPSTEPPAPALPSLNNTTSLSHPSANSVLAIALSQAAQTIDLSQLEVPHDHDLNNHASGSQLESIVSAAELQTPIPINEDTHYEPSQDRKYDLDEDFLARLDPNNPRHAEIIKLQSSIREYDEANLQKRVKRTIDTVYKASSQKVSTRTKRIDKVKAEDNFANPPSAKDNFANSPSANTEPLTTTPIPLDPGIIIEIKDEVLPGRMLDATLPPADPKTTSSEQTKENNTGLTPQGRKKKQSSKKPKAKRVTLADIPI